MRDAVPLHAEIVTPAGTHRDALRAPTHEHVTVIAGPVRRRARGWPACNARPRGADVVRDVKRSVEPVFAVPAVPAVPGCAGRLRAHEVGRVRAVPGMLPAIALGAIVP